MAIKESERLVYTVAEAGKLLDLSRATAFSLARRGKLPGCIRIGDKRFIVSKLALEKFLETGNIPS